MNTESLASTLRQAGELGDLQVAAAFEAVPRDLFLPDFPPETVYSDTAVYNRTDDQGAFLGGADQPSQVARMLTQAQLEPGMNVLEIGTGTGYSAALLQHIVGKGGYVTTLEIDKATVKTAQDHLLRAHMGSVNVVHVDGVSGYSPRASYDRIISTVAIDDIPPLWIKQLRPDGLIVAPILLDGLQVIATLKVQQDDSLISNENYSCSFVPIQGSEISPINYMYMGGGSALRIYSNEVKTLDSAALHLLMLNDSEQCHLGVSPSADDYWDGFAPFLMLNVPKSYDFVCYAVEGGKIVYGLIGRGFGLITQGGAVFVNVDEMGNTHCFAGVDSFIAVADAYTEWEKMGKPRISQLGIHMKPASEDKAPENGMIFRRKYHDLRVWLD